MKVLDLFSGIGGFSLGLERAGMETVAFCEIEEFPRKVLAKHWPDVPIYKDVRTLKGQDIGTIDVICGGYPCQPFSVAGERRGQEDDRHLWPEVNRLLAELRPTWFIGENVAGHISMGLDDVLSDLEGQGYAARPFVIPACAVNAPHRRDRVWIVANRPEFTGDGSQCQFEPCQEGRQDGQSGGGDQQGIFPHTCSDRRQQGSDRQPVQANPERTSQREQKRGMGGAYTPQTIAADAHNAGSQGRIQNGGTNPEGWQKSGDGRAAKCSHRRDWNRACHWEPEPGLGRVANGVPNRVDRLKALGNAVVPQVVEMIGHAIMDAHHGR